MKKIILLLVPVISLLIACSDNPDAVKTQNVQALNRDTTDKEPNRLLPKKLRGIPVGMSGSHDPNPVSAVYENGMYIWKHNTSIQSLSGDLKLVEYGSFVWTDDDWYLRVTMSPEEFAQTYNCPGAILKAGIIYTDPSSWRHDKELVGGDAMWYYIAEDKNGNRFKGTILIETEASLAPSGTDTGTYQFSTEKSKIIWTGYGETGDYSLSGMVPVKAGYCNLNGTVPANGQLIIQMKNMSSGNENLIDHLKGDDFFKTEKFPEAVYELKSAKAEGDSCLLSGELTICGIKKPIETKAVVLRYGKMCQIISDFRIDRTQWGIRYNSSSFFSNVGDQAIRNDIRIQFVLTGEQE